MGRHAKDPAQQIRARLWAQCVFQKQSGSWDKLDKRFVWLDEEPEDRIRVMHAIFRDGKNPTKVKVGEVRIDLVDRINRTEGFEGTAAIYYSRLWDILIPPRKSFRELYALNALVSNSLGLYQMTDAEWRTVSYLLPNESFCKRGTGVSALKHSIERLVGGGGLNELCLLCLQVRLSINDLALAEAILFLEGARKIAAGFEGRFELNNDLLGDLLTLIEKRGFRDDWTPITPLAMSNPPRKNSVKKLLATFEDDDSVPMARGQPISKRAQLRQGGWTDAMTQSIADSDRQYAYGTSTRPVIPLLPLEETLEDFVGNYQRYLSEARSSRLHELRKTLSDETDPGKRLAETISAAPLLYPQSDRPRQADIIKSINESEEIFRDLEEDSET